MTDAPKGPNTDAVVALALELAVEGLMFVRDQMIVSRNAGDPFLYVDATYWMEQLAAFLTGASKQLCAAKEAAERSKDNGIQESNKGTGQS